MILQRLSCFDVEDLLPESAFLLLVPAEGRVFVWLGSSFREGRSEDETPQESAAHVIAEAVANGFQLKVRPLSRKGVAEVSPTDVRPHALHMMQDLRVTVEEEGQETGDFWEAYDS